MRTSFPQFPSHLLGDNKDRECCPQPGLCTIPLQATLAPFFPPQDIVIFLIFQHLILADHSFTSFISLPQWSSLAKIPFCQRTPRPALVFTCAITFLPIIHKSCVALNKLGMQSAEISFQHKVCARRANELKFSLNYRQKNSGPTPLLFPSGNFTTG